MIKLPLENACNQPGLRRAVVTTLLAVATFASAGCSNTMVPTTEYLIRSDPPFAVEEPAPVHIARLSVRVSPYLDRSGIVVKTAAREVRPARNHLWAEPLHNALASLLLDEIGRALGGNVGSNIDTAPRFEVEVAVDQLHGALNGRVHLVADYRLLSGGNVVGVFRFADAVDQTSEGYAAMVDAEVELATRLAQAIARALLTAT